MSRRSPRRPGQRGFTLAEMMVAVAVLGIVFSAVLGGLQVGVASSRVGGGRVEAQQSARIGLDRIMRDLRSAGYDPTSSAFTVVTTASAAQIVVQSDLNGSGTIVAPVAGVCDPAAESEIVQYRVVSGQLMRSVNPAQASCEAAVIGGVQALAFTYLDATGAAPASNAAIRTVQVQLTMIPEQTTGAIQAGAMVATMMDQARIRNR